MDDYLCYDGKPYQWPEEVVAQGLDHDYIEYFPAGWREQTEEDRRYLTPFMEMCYGA